MNVGMKLTGSAAIRAELRNAGLRVPDAARKTMHRAADRIVKEAKLNTPVDEHNLEESITKEVSYSPVRGRLQIDIDVGGLVNGVNVDLYALRIHENYDENHPGPGTAAKRAANPGRHVGGKFLERAVEAERPKVQPSLIQAVLKAIRGVLS